LGTDKNKIRHYQSKGIRICKEWDSFPVFMAWAIEHGWEKGLTLDRIDPRGNYEPANCRWATPLQQGETKSNKAVVTVGDETLTVSQWSRRIGIGLSTLFRRYYKGIRGAAFVAPIDAKKSRRITASM
jgi:hypothetical protein